MERVNEEWEAVLGQIAEEINTTGPRIVRGWRERDSETVPPPEEMGAPTEITLYWVNGTVVLWRARGVWKEQPTISVAGLETLDAVEWDDIQRANRTERDVHGPVQRQREQLGYKEARTNDRKRRIWDTTKPRIQIFVRHSGIWMERTNEAAGEASLPFGSRRQQDVAVKYARRAKGN